MNNIKNKVTIREVKKEFSAPVEEITKFKKTRKKANKKKIGHKTHSKIFFSTYTESCLFKG